MRIAITGSSGLIGNALIQLLELRGNTVTRLVRPGSRSGGIVWDPDNGTIDLAGLEGHDGVVHLAGESIAGLWTESRKRRIRGSRMKGTTLIATSLAKLKRPPSALVSASAVGYYGDRGGETLNESASRGTGFLAEVAEEWERATEAASAAGIRVANTRFGLVLSRDGGAMGPLLPLFKAGLGGRIGNGRQFWSWVTLHDVARSIEFALQTATIAGPVNVVAPHPVTNKAFTRTLGRVLGRPTIFAVPELVLKTVAGDMARELLLSSARVVPKKLQDAGYVFSHTDLETAFKDVLYAKPFSMFSSFTSSNE